jgi:hypothetical protein
MINEGPNILQVVLMSYHEANACLSWRWHEHRQDFHRLGSVITTWLKSAIKRPSFIQKAEANLNPLFMMSSRRT